jgi:hypothetical protein
VIRLPLVKIRLCSGEVSRSALLQEQATDACLSVSCPFSLHQPVTSIKTSAPATALMAAAQRRRTLHWSPHHADRFLLASSDLQLFQCADAATASDRGEGMVIARASRLQRKDAHWTTFYSRILRLSNRDSMHYALSFAKQTRTSSRRPRSARSISWI